jgi:plastocyanin
MYTRKIRCLALLAILLLSLTLAACGGSQQSTSAASAASNSAPSSSGTADATTVNIVASNFAFALDIPETSAGTITFTLKNAGSAQHDFEISGNGIKQKTAKLNQNESASFTVVLAPGTYTYRCTVPAHDALGMKGSFAVK